MKKILTLIFLICTLSAFSSIKYVATTGNDGNSGTQASPYLTVKYGVEHSTDTCYINAGTYTLLNEAIYIPIGVKIVGADSATTIINCRYTASGTFYMWSATNLDGNHSLYNLKLDGGMIGYAAIYDTRRSNITVNRCVIKNFVNSGINVTDGVDTDAGSPSISNFTITNNQLINCSSYEALGSPGIVWLRGTKDGEISNNIITSTRGESAGLCVKMSHSQNYKIHDNIIKVLNHDDAVSWIFAMENNHITGGVEVYNNVIEGLVDVAGRSCQKGSYNYSISIHDNLFGTATLTSMYKYGIELENVPTLGGQDMSDVLIYNNTFRNLSNPIFAILYPPTIMQRIKIYNNLIYNVGIDQNINYASAFSYQGPGSGLMRDIYFDNNTIIGASAAIGKQLVGIGIPERDNVVRNFRIRNNIIVGFDRSAIETGNMYATGTIDSIYIQNNNLYGNGNSNNPYWYGITPTNIISSGGLKTDPLFVSTSDFRLQSGSPMIDAGLNVGLTTDIIGYPITGNPDIGAYEFNPGILINLVKWGSVIGKWNGQIIKW